MMEKGANENNGVRANTFEKWTLAPCLNAFYLDWKLEIELKSQRKNVNIMGPKC